MEGYTFSVQPSRQGGFDIIRHSTVGETVVRNYSDKAEADRQAAQMNRLARATGGMLIRIV